MSLKDFKKVLSRGLLYMSENNGFFFLFNDSIVWCNSLMVGVDDPNLKLTFGDYLLNNLLKEKNNKDPFKGKNMVYFLKTKKEGVRIVDGFEKDSNYYIENSISSLEKLLSVDYSEFKEFPVCNKESIFAAEGNDAYGLGPITTLLSNPLDSFFIAVNKNFFDYLTKVFMNGEVSPENIKYSGTNIYFLGEGKIRGILEPLSYFKTLNELVEYTSRIY